MTQFSPQRGLIFVSVTVCYSVSVTTTEILAALDTEIARLQEARNALAGLSGATRRGRPSASALASQTTNKKRVLSAAAREKIAAAQRKRWAKQKKSA
jgi:low affinity Fe/Cu permease